jgi:hypothetical protein
MGYCMDLEDYEKRITNWNAVVRCASKACAITARENWIRRCAAFPIDTVPSPTRKFGGVRVTLTRVASSGKCVCGRTYEECVEYWYTFLGITGHSGEARFGDYSRNLAKQRRAEQEGHDPYCFRARLRSYGYVPDWTPYYPAGTFPLPKQLEEQAAVHVPKQVGGKRAKATGRSGRKRGSGTTTR